MPVGSASSSNGASTPRRARAWASSSTNRPLVFGIAPRLTVVVPVTLAVLGYLLDTFGTALDWPNAVLALSPFHHLGRLPGAPMTLAAIAVMTAIGAAAATAGIAAFAQRDLRGA